MNSKKKKYFFFPKFQLYHLLFLAFFITSFIKKGMQTYFEKNQKLAIEFLKLYMYDIGDFFSIIPYKITKRRTNIIKSNPNINLENIRSGTKSTLIFNDKKNKKHLKRNFIIFTLVDFIAQISPVIYYVIKEDQRLQVKLGNLNSILIFNVLGIILFSFLLLHTNFYRHHLLAFFIDIVCMIGLTTIDLYEIFTEPENNKMMSIIYILVKILSVVLYSLENVLVKIMILYNYLTTYALLYYKSIFHFVYLLIFSFPFIFKKIPDKNGELSSIFSMIADIFDDKIYFAIIIIYTTTSFFYNNLCQKIIDVFSPNHFAITRVMENFAIFLTDLIINGPGEIDDLIIRIIMYILMIFSTFVFNEFLVINICGLSKNTKLFLDYEAENEILFFDESGEESNTVNSENDFNSTGIELE